ncbi:MAG: DUF4258 domain-containing protein [Phycisphaeraceae bacterium]|nr:DUF4258 domain-containing protein [Phycisphaeraceae bacterium]MBX3405551.1 DUF4258 domain-containing protein [Phycisphaeraceae bacterium]
MGNLNESIRSAIAAERLLVSSHADDMFRERGIVLWQVIAAMSEATLLIERPRSQPNPVAEYELVLADGTPVKAVWSYIRSLDVAKLVTVHFFDR